MTNLQFSNSDLDSLVNFRKSDSAAEIIFRSFANRQNKMKVTTITSLHLRVVANGVSRKDIRRTLIKLQELNCGKYLDGKVRGAANEQSRFIWEVSLVSVGKATLRETSKALLSPEKREPMTVEGSFAMHRVSIWLSARIARLRGFGRESS